MKGRFLVYYLSCAMNRREKRRDGNIISVLRLFSLSLSCSKRIIPARSIAIVSTPDIKITGYRVSTFPRVEINSDTAVIIETSFLIAIVAPGARRKVESHGRSSKCPSNLQEKKENYFTKRSITSNRRFDEIKIFLMHLNRARGLSSFLKIVLQLSFLFPLPPPPVEKATCRFTLTVRSIRRRRDERSAKYIFRKPALD